MEREPPDIASQKIVDRLKKQEPEQKEPATGKET
jgi:hypothetical protein